MSDALFFKSKNEVKSWFQKNHRKLDQQWIGIFKKTSGAVVYTGADVAEVALCFGWTGVIIKSIDYFSYKLLYVKRKENSTWSPGSVKKFKELMKQKKVSTFAKWSFEHRNQKATKKMVEKLSSAQTKVFKKNKKAWAFFQTQTPSYQKYMAHWINAAIQKETQTKRLQELIHDSGNGTKLLRVLKAQEKFSKNRRRLYPEGQTPIEEGKNLGPATGRELRSIGIETLEQLKSMGWEKAFDSWIQYYPYRMKLVVLHVLIGAIENQAYHKIDSSLKAEAKSFFQETKSGFLR